MKIEWTKEDDHLTVGRTNGMFGPIIVAEIYDTVAQVYHSYIGFDKLNKQNHHLNINELKKWCEIEVNNW